MASPAVSRLLASTVVRQSLLVFGASMSANAINFAFYAVVSHRLGVRDYGAIGALLNLATLLAIPAAIATTIVARFAAEFTATGDAAKLRRLWITNVIGALAIGAIVFLVMALFRERIGAYFQIPPSRSLAVVMTGLLLFANLSAPGIRGTFQGMQKFREYGLLVLVETAIKFCSGIVFVDMGYGVVGVMAGFALGLWLSDLLGLVLLARSGGVAPQRLHLDLRRLVQTTLGVGGATIVTIVLSTMDILFVEHYFTTYEAGLFTAGSLVGKILFFAVAFIPTIVLPRATALAKRGESPLPALREAALLTIVVAIGGLFVVGLGAKYFILILNGDKYLAAVPYVFKYALAMALLGALMTVTAYKSGLHRFDFVIPIAVVGALEIAAIVLFHSTLDQVLWWLVLGHGLAFAVSLYGILDGVPTSAKRLLARTGATVPRV